MGSTDLSKTNLATIEAFEKGYVVVDNKVFHKGKPIKTNISNHGYSRFAVRLSSKKVCSILVHKLVAYQKFGLKSFDKKMHIRHFDSNSLNNLEDNILLGTPSENNMDKPKELRIKMSIHAVSFVKKYDHEEIIKMHDEGLSYSKIMEITGIKSKGTISFIVKQSMASKIN